MNKARTSSKIKVEPDLTTKENKVKILESSFLKTILGFLAAFIIGSVVVVVFFILCSFFEFSSNFEFDFWVKAIISLVMAALALKVANVVNPQNTNVSKAVPYTLLTLFFCILIWHYGLRDRPVSERRERRNNIETPIVSDSDYEYSFTLKKGETSPWIKFPVGYNMNTLSDKGNYKIIYDNGTVCDVVVGKENNFPDVRGKVNKVCFKSEENGQTIKVSFRRL